MKSLLKKKIKRETSVKQELVLSIFKSILISLMICFIIFYNKGELPLVLSRLGESNDSSLVWFLILLPCVIVINVAVTLFTSIVELNRTKN